MDERYREAAKDVFEEARTNIDILLRVREGYDGTIPFNMDEVIDYMENTFPETKRQVIQRHILCNGGKECFEENMPWLTDVIKRWKATFGSSQ
ncbi:hypothetical protein J4402_04505 [Candidatus Pacearchaeota archaeon]|nr:hypothetical protein [Candidatus Pacearchaeota archaeon]